MADLKKPRPTKCEACGNPAQPFLRPEVKFKGTIVFPARWMERNECEDCEKKRFEREEAQADAQQERERLKHAGLEDARLARLEFRHYRTDHPARERVARLIRPVYSHLGRTGVVRNLLLYGGSGGGKTMLAACFIRAAIDKKLRGKFFSWPELCLKFREEDLHGRKLQFVESLLAYEVLVLDDIGAEKATDFVIENLYLIVNKWWDKDKSGLIITTNKGLGDISQTYGDRISSRIAGMSVLVDFEGCPDGRIDELTLGDK